MPKKKGNAGVVHVGNSDLSLGDALAGSRRCTRSNKRGKALVCGFDACLMYVATTCWRRMLSRSHGVGLGCVLSASLISLPVLTGLELSSHPHRVTLSTWQVE